MSLPHEHVIERIRPDELFTDDLIRRTEQVSYMMVGVQRYYTDELGLVRVDPDSPPGCAEDNEWRIGRLEASGDLAVTGLEYVIARRLERPKHGEEARPSERLDGICGMVVLGKERLCRLGRHTETELVEFDVVAGERGHRLGRTLLKEALSVVHPKDRMRLYVAEPNKSAIDLYRRMGLSFTGEEMKHGGIFEYPDGECMPHLPMTANVADVQEILSKPNLPPGRLR